MDHAPLNGIILSTLLFCCMNRNHHHFYLYTALFFAANVMVFTADDPQPVRSMMLTVFEFLHTLILLTQLTIKCLHIACIACTVCLQMVCDAMP